MSPGAVRPTLRPSADKYSPHQFRTFPFHTCLEICCRVVGISRKLFGQVGRDSIRVMSRVVETPEASRPPVPQLRPPAPQLRPPVPRSCCCCCCCPPPASAPPPPAPTTRDPRLRAGPRLGGCREGGRRGKALDNGFGSGSRTRSVASPPCCDFRLCSSSGSTCIDLLPPRLTIAVSSAAAAPSLPSRDGQYPDLPSQQEILCGSSSFRPDA